MMLEVSWLCLGKIKRLWNGQIYKLYFYDLGNTLPLTWFTVKQVCSLRVLMVGVILSVLYFGK